MDVREKIQGLKSRKESVSEEYYTKTHKIIEISEESNSFFAIIEKNKDQSIGIPIRKENLNNIVPKEGDTLEIIYNRDYPNSVAGQVLNGNQLFLKSEDELYKEQMESENEKNTNTRDALIEGYKRKRERER